MSGNLNCSTVFLLLASERWKKASFETGDTLYVYHPWYIQTEFLFPLLNDSLPKRTLQLTLPILTSINGESLSVKPLLNDNEQDDYR